MRGTGWELPTPPLPRLEGRIEANVCVIGLGGSGLSALARLQKNRVRNLVGIDAVGVAAGAAGRNGGFLLAGPAHFHHRAVQTWGRAAAVELYRLTEARIEEMARRWPDLVDLRGSVRLPGSAAEADDIAAHHQALLDDGFTALPYAGPRGERGLLVPGDGVFHPAERCLQLADRVWDKGAWLYGGDPVEVIDGTTVRTAHGGLQSPRPLARFVVVCLSVGSSNV